MVEMDEWDERIRVSVSRKRQSSYAGTTQLQRISTASRARNREKVRRGRTRTILVKC